MAAENSDITLLGLEDANKRLDDLIAADAATDKAGEQTPTDESATTDAATRAAAEVTGDQKPEEKPDAAGKGTKADGTTETKKDEKPGEKAGEKKPEEKPGDKSRYAKAQERQQRSWDELNAQKDALKSDRATLDKEREELRREREELATERAKAEDQYNPQQYEDAAKEFEAKGQFELAELARKKAEHLRRNPPPKKADVQEAQRKEWALKAGVDYPEVAKQNSPMQVRVAQLLAEDSDFKRHPKGIYVAARIASLEAEVQKHKTEADKVAQKDTEIKKLQDRVKELEGFTAPGGEGGAQRIPAAKTFGEMTDAEQFSELEREARQVGFLGAR